MPSVTGAGANIPELDADLLFPSNNGQDGFVSLTAIDATAGVNVISAYGKFSFPYLLLSGLPTSENITVNLTIDGNVIFNATFTPGNATLRLVGASNSTEESAYLVKESLLLYVQTTSDTNIGCQYLLRPIK